MLTIEQIQSLDINIDPENSTEKLMAETALEWIGENTTIDISDIDNLPACAKLFISKFCEVCSLTSGVSSESVDGLSQSFSSQNKADLLWDLANTFMSSKLKGQIRFIPAQKRFV